MLNILFKGKKMRKFNNIVTIGLLLGGMIAAGFGNLTICAILYAYPAGRAGAGALSELIDGNGDENEIY
jgi:hypothetical protein